MKKSILHLFASIALVTLLSGCNSGKQTDTAGDTAGNRDSITAAATTTPTATPTPAPSEDPTEPEMESQGGMYKPVDISRYWDKRTITVPGKKSDIVALFEAFYAEWPTIEGSRIVHTTNPALAPDETYYEEGSEIDRKNGYVESAWYEGEDLGTVSACVWGRKNGHKLFAVNFSGGDNFLCFYDFDPATRTLTPEENPVKKEHLNFRGKAPLWYTLPRIGKTLEVVEDAPGDNVAFTYYTFDGQNLKFAGHTHP